MAKAFMAVSSVSPSKEPKPSSMNSESSRTAPEWFCTTSESPKARDKEAKNCSPPERVSMERGSIEAPSSTSKSRPPYPRVAGPSFSRRAYRPRLRVAKNRLALPSTSSSITLSTYCKMGIFMGLLPERDLDSRATRESCPSRAASSSSKRRASWRAPSKACRALAALPSSSRRVRLSCRRVWHRCRSWGSWGRSSQGVGQACHWALAFSRACWAKDKAAWARSRWASSSWASWSSLAAAFSLASYARPFAWIASSKAL